MLVQARAEPKINEVNFSANEVYFRICNILLGAIIGDIVGSTREWHNIKTEIGRASCRERV